MSKKIIKIMCCIVILTITFLLGRFYEIRKIEKNPKVLGVTLEKINLGISTWVGYGPFWLAKDKGFFNDEDLDINIKIIEDSAQRKAAVLNNSINALADTPDQLVISRSQNIPSVAVMQIDISNGADGILATGDIKTIKDLKGKKVAVQKNFVSESFLYYMLKQNGMSPQDINIVDMEAGSAGAAFVSGQVDAAVTFEPWMSKANQRAGGHILTSSRDANGVIADILTVNQSYLNDHPQAVKKLMRGWFKALEYIKQNPGDAYQIMAKHYNVSAEEFKNLINGVTWNNLAENLNYIGTEKEPGKILEIISTFANIFMETGQIKSKPNMQSAINGSLLKELSN